jgi:hypothetical protein
MQHELGMDRTGARRRSPPSGIAHQVMRLTRSGKR